MAHESNTPPLAVPSITPADLQLAAMLHIPEQVRVCSANDIKVRAVADALHAVHPHREFNIIGVQTPSRVDQQPLGQHTIDGSLNRLYGGMQTKGRFVPHEVSDAAWFSVESGLFRVAGQKKFLTPIDRSSEGIIHFTEAADLSTKFDDNAKYEDRAAVAIRIPTRRTVVQVSPASEAVVMPRAVVLDTYYTLGSFEHQTIGEALAKKGMVRDAQNPHLDLTANRAAGPLSRQEQIAQSTLRGLVNLAILYADNTEQ